MKPLLSVCLITYNHAKYIKQSIEGVLAQKVNFSWELVIADDCSTDGTREIILEYKKRYPRFIKLILQQKNVGAHKNWLDLVTYPSSKYIAYLEGDDYWIDPLKLKKQIDFLRKNNQYVCCFTNAIFLNEITKQASTYVTYLQEGDVPIEKIIRMGGYIYPSSTIVFRRDIIDENIFANYLNHLSGDTSLMIVAAMKGRVFFLQQETTVYRRWLGGLYSSVSRNIPSIVTWKTKEIRGYKQLQKIIDAKYLNVVKEKISSESIYIIRNSKNISRLLLVFNLTKSDLKALMRDWLTAILNLIFGKVKVGNRNSL